MYYFIKCFSLRKNFINSKVYLSCLVMLGVSAVDVSSVVAAAGSAEVVATVVGIIPRFSVRANIDWKRAYRAANAAWPILLSICGSATGSGWASALA